ncbi:M81 family metallopeptidase [Bacillus sp. 3255]|uniref:M81 family metallopeptidase n=1 Tax=Bacillus sp. 3255 TaxID=2817904 RepID=UPI00285A1781|nr:M81 family metallopeptidase [Bacillus sp. 3255]MDR6884157.1 microcystin degradation protein MlrC [Bacillus sp. 3255]
MKIAVLGVFHETNTFAPDITGLEAFSSEWVLGNEAFVSRYGGTRTSMGGAIDALCGEDIQLACGLYAGATPSGIVAAEAAERLIDAFSGSLDVTSDGVLVILHGAMVAEGLPDVEGELLRRVRERIGPSKPIVATLDLHANISPEMARLANILVGYDTYPHIDAYERAVEAAQLLIRTVSGNIVPTLALAKPGMLVVPQVMLTHEEGPMKELMDRAFAMELEPNVLNVTVAGGFPYSDVPDAGLSFVVTTENDLTLAECYAEELKRMAWDRRHLFTYADLPVEEAVSRAMEIPEGPVILVEGSDNVGGGAPADATHTLVHLINPVRRTLIVIRDEEAAAAAHELGVGAEYDGHIGGRSGRLHGEPVRIRGIIRTLFDGRYTHIGPYMTGQRADMGKTAVIEAGLLTVMVTEKRTAPWDPGHIRSAGLQADDYHVIVVKSAVAWKTAFGSICKAVIPVDTPGCCSSNLSHFPYKQIQRPVFPLD